MDIFYTLLFVYITILIVCELLPVLIYFSFGLIVLSILLYILKMVFPGGLLLCRSGSLLFKKKNKLLVYENILPRKQFIFEAQFGFNSGSESPLLF
jgi:hypothetical protein